MEYEDNLILKYTLSDIGCRYRQAIGGTTGHAYQICFPRKRAVLAFSLKKPRYGRSMGSRRLTEKSEMEKGVPFSGGEVNEWRGTARH